jgi:hypothetical protein
MNGAPTREESGKVAKYIASELGDLRSFSLDSPESRVGRMDALRKVKW